MSLQFSDTTNKRGIVQLIDATLGTNSISYPIEDKTRDINLTLDHILAKIFQVGGRWQFDDSNHTDYPIISTNLVSGQRDYSFTVDGSSNLILEIFKVFVADENGLFREITPVDVPEGAPSNYWDGLNTTGQPNSYDKLANGIILDPIPNYSRALGLKVYINREASYFTTADTIKKPGIAGLFHEYFALRPSYQYAYRKGLESAPRIEAEMLRMEGDIENYYKSRERDLPKVFRPMTNNPH